MSQASVCHRALFPRFTILDKKKVLQRADHNILQNLEKKNKTWLGFGVNHLACVTVSHLRKEKLRSFVNTLLRRTRQRRRTMQKRERKRSGGMWDLLSATYLIAHRFWWMDWPVIWDLLRQAKVPHNSWAHAALPAHQAVLHRGVRGHTHTHTHTTHHITFTASTCVFVPVFTAALFVFKQHDRVGAFPKGTFHKKLTKSSRFLCRFPLQSEYFHRLLALRAPGSPYGN